MPKRRSEDERIAELEAIVPEISTRLNDVRDSLASLQPKIAPLTFSRTIGDVAGLPATIASPIIGLLFDLAFPRIPGDFETTAAKAGFLAIEGQLTIGAQLADIEAIKVPQTPAEQVSTKNALLAGIGAVQTTLSSAQDALKLAGAAAAAGKKFADAMQDLENAVRSFLEAAKELKELQVSLLSVPPADINFPDSKNKLKAAATKIQTDLGNVKGALGKITLD